MSPARSTAKDQHNVDAESRMTSMSIMNTTDNKFYVDMINLRKKLKKEEE